MSENVIELRKSAAPALRQTVETLIEQLDEAGRITGFAVIVFAENARRQPISEQVFSVAHLTEAIGAVEAMKADLVDEYRHATDSGDCPECGT